MQPATMLEVQNWAAVFLNIIIRIIIPYLNGSHRAEMYSFVFFSVLVIVLYNNITGCPISLPYRSLYTFSI